MPLQHGSDFSGTARITMRLQSAKLKKAPSRVDLMKEPTFSGHLPPLLQMGTKAVLEESAGGARLDHPSKKWPLLTSIQNESCTPLQRQGLGLPAMMEQSII